MEDLNLGFVPGFPCESTSFFRLILGLDLSSDLPNKNKQTFPLKNLPDSVSGFFYDTFEAM